MNTVRRAGRGALWPVRRLLDPRFADVNRRLTATSQETRDALDKVTKRVNDIVGSYAESQLESATFVGAQLRALETAVQALSLENEVLVAEIAERSDPQQERAIGEELARLTAGGGIDDLEQPVADLLNYALSHRGFAAQAELWLNPPLVIEYREREVRLADVNARIVEIPFAMRAIGRLEPGARVLDFGGSESSLALSLASLGYATTALDLRRYPFEHPGLAVVMSPIEEWDAEPESFDAALCISTLEHVGLGWYGDPRRDDGDRQALQIISERLVPQGLLVLTVPYGAGSVDAVQRRYDRPRLDALLEGWETLERRVVEQVDERVWQPVEESTGNAVALVLARKPPLA